ncbi:hypothetical protein B0T10DRAFT_411160, partial [Thelonectria olida]
IETLEAHGATVMSVAFSVDGQRLASSSADRTVKIWDVATRACIQTLNVNRVITHLSFDPMTNSYLSTDIGIINLGLPPIMDTQMIEVLRDISHCGYGISIDGEWVVKDGKSMLWLPPEYRASSSAALGSTVVIGRRSGRVLPVVFQGGQHLLVMQFS